MITLNEWTISLVLGSLIALFVLNIILFVKLDKYRQREEHKKHFCNHCEMAFLSIKDLDKTNCDYCGRPLTLHIEDPNFQEEKALEGENNIDPFEEFK